MTKIAQPLGVKYANLLRAIADGEEVQLLNSRIWPCWEDKNHTEVLQALFSKSYNGAVRFDECWRTKPTVKFRRAFVEFNPKLDNSHNAPNVEYIFNSEYPHALKSVKML